MDLEPEPRHSATMAGRATAAHRKLLHALKPTGCGGVAFVLLSGLLWPLALFKTDQLGLIDQLRVVLVGAVSLLRAYTFLKVRQLQTALKDFESGDNLPRSLLGLCQQFEVGLALVASLSIGLFLTW